LNIYIYIYSISQYIKKVYHIIILVLKDYKNWFEVLMFLGGFKKFIISKSRTFGELELSYPNDKNLLIYLIMFPSILDKNEINIIKEKGVYTVEGEWLLNLVNSVNFDDRESVMYFQRVLNKGGVIDRLREAGASDGDSVSIYEVEFDFVD